MARSSRRILAAGVAALSLALVLAGTTGAPPAATAATGPAAVAPVAADPISYTPETVVVPASVVREQLMKVSADGAAYTFKSRTGVLKKLKTGSVMLLSKKAVRNVTSAKVVKRHLVVKTTAASLTDVVSTGTLAWDTKVDWSRAFAVSGGAVPLRPAGQRAAGAITLKGKVKGYEYSATFTPSATGMTVKIAITRESPVEVEISITGSLTDLSTVGSATVAQGQLSKAEWLAKNISGKLTLAYSAKPVSALGLGQAGGIKITLPAEIAVPFMVGPIPFYVGIKVAFFASAGFSGFDQELQGSYTLDYDGSGGFKLSSDGATTPQGVLDGLGAIILGAAQAVATGPISFVLGAQMPQLELGVGTKGLNIAGTLTLVGQTGIATYGAGCDTRKFQILGTAGANASFFGLEADLYSQKLFDKSYYASYPSGCGTFPG